MTTHSSRHDAPPPNATPARPKLLVVDCEPFNIQVIYQVFSADYQVFMATTGEQALLMCRENPPDLILMDVLMSGMNGLEVCARLKADEKTSFIPVIFMGAQTGAHHITHALEPGAVDFISKPVNASVLRARVKTHLTTKFQTDFFRTMACMDPLTGLFNFRDFEQRLNSEWARSIRAKTPLSMLLLEVDNLEAFSQSNGWLAADGALKDTAQILKNHLRRPADMVARYGKPVFACLAPETSHADTLMIANKIRQEFNEDRPTADMLGLSIGLVTRVNKADGNATEMLTLTQQQLRLAQNQGGKQICHQTMCLSNN